MADTAATERVYTQGIVRYNVGHKNRRDKTAHASFRVLGRVSDLETARATKSSTPPGNDVYGCTMNTWVQIGQSEDASDRKAAILANCIDMAVAEEHQFKERVKGSRDLTDDDRIREFNEMCEMEKRRKARRVVAEGVQERANVASEYEFAAVCMCLDNTAAGEHLFKVVALSSGEEVLRDHVRKHAATWTERYHDVWVVRTGYWITPEILNLDSMDSIPVDYGTFPPRPLAPLAPLAPLTRPSSTPLPGDAVLNEKMQLLTTMADTTSTHEVVPCVHHDLFTRETTAAMVVA